jgi:DDE_Tnp_1-associated
VILLIRFAEGAMEAVAGSAAYGEAIVFLGCFRDFPDPRQRGKVIYPLEEVLLLCLLAVLAGAETFVDISRFGQKKIAFLRRILPFRDGTPSHDHLGDIFATLDDTEFQRRFVAWVAKPPVGTAMPRNQRSAARGRLAKRMGGDDAKTIYKERSARPARVPPSRRAPSPRRPGATRRIRRLRRSAAAPA